jgi:hypothetical protein
MRAISPSFIELARIAGAYGRQPHNLTAYRFEIAEGT